MSSSSDSELRARVLADPASMPPGAYAQLLDGLNLHAPLDMARDEQMAVDVVTQLQEQLELIGKHAYNFVGSLTRDAPPVAADGTPVETAGAVPAYTPADLAAQVVGASQRFDALASSLPPGGGASAVRASDASDAGIAALMAENESLGRELQRELSEAEGVLASVRARFVDEADNMSKNVHR